MYYTPQSTGRFFANEDEMGVNAPVVHQRIIAQLTAGLYPLYKAGAIPYEPLPETMLTEGYASPTPDIIMYDTDTEQAVIIIEICQTKGAKADLDKVTRLIDSDLYGILEGFVYNYRTGHWLRYRKGDGGLSTESSFSELLQIDFGPFLT